ncbi:MAG: polymer-forming cytoskeletal protein [Woeseia sp.]
MFERGKKDESLDEGADLRSAAPPRSQESPGPRAPSRGGECAVIGRSIQINGEVRGNEDLRIEGDVGGTVELKDSNLTIGKDGKVRADVYAKSIVVDGTTEGDLYATERVIVHINAHVRGNITSPKVAVEEGAKFKGSIEMDQEAVEKAFGKVNLQGARPVADRPDRQPGKAADVKVAPKGIVKEAAPSVNPPTGVR